MNPQDTTYEPIDYKTVKITTNTPQVVIVDIEKEKKNVELIKTVVGNLTAQIEIYQAQIAKYQASSDASQALLDSVANVVLPEAPIIDTQ